VCSSPGEFVLHLVDSNDCGYSDTIRVRYGCADRAWLPSAFTPDGDGLNDFFRASGNTIQEGLLRVFSSTNEEIFRAAHPAGWDGTYKGKPCQAGVYLYIFTYKTGQSDATNQLGGTVTLLR
jgi:gliding motility-associated-like protein